MKKLIVVCGVLLLTSKSFAQVQVTPAPKVMKSNTEMVPANQQVKTDLGEFERVETRNPDGSVTVNVIKKGSAPALSADEKIKHIDGLIDAIEQKWKTVASDPGTDAVAKNNGWYTKQEAELKRLRAEKEMLSK